MDAAGSALQVLQEVTQLEVDYWREVDRNWGRAAHEFYVGDGVFAIGSKVIQGAAAIAEFYRWREGRGARVARHVVTNFSIADRGEGTVSFACIMCLYAADGVPVLPSKPAIMIADITAQCRKDTAGRWRFSYHKLEPLFMGGEAPTLGPDEAKA